MKNNLIDIQQELINTVTGFYRNEKDTFYNMDMISRYQMVYETVSFLFEDYRVDFNRIIHDFFGPEITEEKMDVEGIVFISWISIGVITELSMILNKCHQNILEKNK